MTPALGIGGGVLRAGDTHSFVSSESVSASSSAMALSAVASASAYELALPLLSSLVSSRTCQLQPWGGGLMMMRFVNRDIGCGCPLEMT